MDILNKLLTVILFLNCLFMLLLVLVQLPKKEAGLGTAFGGGATDALFGAGAGNVLTKLTKWCAVLFLVLCLALSLPFMNPKGLQEGESSSSKAGGGAKQPSQNGLGQTSTSNATTNAIAPKKPGKEKGKVPGPDKR